MARIFAYIVHKNGVPDDTAAELLTAAKKIDANQAPTAIAAGWGPDLDAVCSSLRASYSETWRIASEALAYPNAELVRKALLAVLPQGSIVLVPHSHFGVDLSPGLSILMNAAYVPDVLDIESSHGPALRMVRQEFGGQVYAHVECDISTGAVINIRPGSFRPQAGVPMAGVVGDKSPAVGNLTARRRYLETIVAETGDVDITKHQILVSVGRGIQDPENIELAQELADALGGAVSCSRPVVDAKWLDKSRQVGSSGQTVQPKVYLACGISGSFQHMAGIKGNPLIVAVNKNSRAPIFQVADVGIIDDVLEFLPAMTNTVRETVAK
jgi:electron transfer flavoprotein alpha subunit